MNFYSADKTGYSPAEAKCLEAINLDINAVLVTRREGFIFNDELLSLNNFVLFDYSEHGWNYHWHYTPMFGVQWNFDNEQYPGEEWRKFNKFIIDKKPLVYFKREILTKDVKDNIYAIDYPNYQQPFAIQTKEEFNSRPINVVMFWGRSSEYRTKLHSEIWAHSSKNGATICDNIYQIGNFLRHENNNNKWISCHQPHYQREPIEQLLIINGMSKLSISLWGCGVKCFRSTGESPVNSIMVKYKDDLKWAYEWVHNYNCIEVKPGKEIEGIEEALKNENLYDIYVQSVNTANKYNIERYTKEYIEPIIKKAL